MAILTSASLDGAFVKRAIQPKASRIGFRNFQNCAPAGLSRAFSNLMGPSSRKATEMTFSRWWKPLTLGIVLLTSLRFGVVKLEGAELPPAEATRLQAVQGGPIDQGRVAADPRPQGSVGELTAAAAGEIVKSSSGSLPLSPLIRTTDLLEVFENHARPVANAQAFAALFDRLLGPAGFGQADVVAFEENAVFTYAVADAYRPDLTGREPLGSLRRYTRHVLLLKPDCLIIDDVWATAAAGAKSGEFRVIGNDGADITRSYSLIDQGHRLDWLLLPVGGPGTHDRPWPNFYRESRATYVFLYSTAADKPLAVSVEGPKLSVGDRVYELNLSRWPAWLYGNSVLAVRGPKGEVILAKRVLPSGVLPHDEEGLRLLERWEAAYRGTAKPGWETGRPSSDLVAAVESGELRPCRVIELGCGSGTNAIYLAKKGFQVTAIDIAPSALRLAEEKSEKEGVRVDWLLGDVLRLPTLPPAELIYDRGCYHGVRRTAAAVYVEAVRRLTLPGSRLLLLAGNAEDTSPGGPPRVTQEQLRSDFGTLFSEQWVRRTQFDRTDRDAAGVGAWSALWVRKPYLPPGELPKQSGLPDPLTFFDGRPVRTPEDWYACRRPELKALFSQYVYGYAPPPAKVTARVVRTDENVFSGKAVLREIELTLHKQADSGPGQDQPAAADAANSPVAVVHLALFTPKQADRRFPVFLSINRCGNHTLTDHPTVRFDPEAFRSSDCFKTGDETGRGGRKDFWCVDYLIERGYAFASFHQSDIAPDAHDFTKGIHARYALPQPKESWWGTIAAWAWGFQRMVDYLIDDPQIDPRRIALIGHSRRGKTALLAAAFDERVALVVPHQSGTGGMALSRGNDQETVERINRVFPHWFNDVFPAFNNNEDRLPVDQHLLVALVAPRRLLDTEGELDKWANPDSAWRNLQAAQRVWRFLGSRGLQSESPIVEPARITADNAGPVAQYRLNIKHTLVREFWEAILDYADVHFAAATR